MKRLEKQEAIRLRLAGKSYNEIRKILGIPSKGTLSYWFRGLSLPPAARERLKSKILLAQKRGLLAFNHERTARVFHENKEERRKGRREIWKLSKKDLFLIGVALYWGEGSQSEKNTSSLNLRFVNSNPSMIALYLRFLREVLHITDNRMHVYIRLYDRKKEGAIGTFWGNITRLPSQTFHFSYQVSSASKYKRPITFLPYGTLDLRVNSLYSMTTSCAIPSSVRRRQVG